MTMMTNQKETKINLCLHQNLARTRREHRLNTLLGFVFLLDGKEITTVRKTKHIQTRPARTFVKKLLVSYYSNVICY